jgi:undecaprenyldiphospho-muramoylpentapeptide beta-N-acetylglucosaminyltransferase
VRLLVCAGGTGGGSYPALAVLQALNARHEDVQTLWVGSEGGMEADLVKREDIAYASIAAAGLHGVGLRALPRNIYQLWRGFNAARRILHDFRPDVLFFTGGYLGGPVALAGRAVPTLLYVPDIEPGIALKVLSRFADRITVSSAESQKYFARKVIVTGYPVRAELTAWTKQNGRAALQLSEDLPVLLVVGGSKGARSINQALVHHLPTLLELTQVVHVAGQLDWTRVDAAAAQLTAGARARYRPFAYLHESMGAALAAADLVLARAGASVLGEFPCFGLPAILAPYPHAWRYQRVNAQYLAQHGAAIVVEDGALDRELPRLVKDLLQNGAKRGAMETAMRSLARPQAAQAIAGELLELGGERP